MAAVSPRVELIDALSEFHWSQRTAAEHLGVHVNTVHRWCVGTLAVPGPALAYIRLRRKVARLLG